MKFPHSFLIYKTALNLAIEKDNLEIVKLLLVSQNIDVNMKSILNQKISYHFTS